MFLHLEDYGLTVYDAG